MLADAGSSVSISPDGEAKMNFGWPETGRGAASRPAPDPFHWTTPPPPPATCSPRCVTAVAAQRDLDGGLDSRTLLEFVTVDAADSCGLGARTGSLTPGKDGDVILVRTDDVIIFPVTDLALQNGLGLLTRPRRLPCWSPARWSNGTAAWWRRSADTAGPTAGLPVPDRGGSRQSRSTELGAPEAHRSSSILGHERNPNAMPRSRVFASMCSRPGISVPAISKGPSTTNWKRGTRSHRSIVLGVSLEQVFYRPVWAVTLPVSTAFLSAA